jgi:hypothetical protein
VLSFTEDLTNPHGAAVDSNKTVHVTDDANSVVAALPTR